VKPGEEKLLNAIHRIAREFPADQREALIAVLCNMPRGDWHSARKRVMDVMNIQPYQQLAAALLDRWQNLAPETSPASLCLGLSAAAYCVEQRQTSLSLELVWTGPLLMRNKGANRREWGTKGFSLSARTMASFFSGR
jgi:hypothetical protein